MVCNRCKKVISEEIENLGIKLLSVELGKIDIEPHDESQLKQIKEVLHKNGFEVLQDSDTQLVERIKIELIKLVETLPIERNEKLSVWLSERLQAEYSRLSKTFSRKEQVTIEKFFLKLKVEKVKELIQQDKNTFSEIAYLLDYSNSNHLAKQFKNETGMSMSEYKKLGSWERKPLDKII